MDRLRFRQIHLDFHTSEHIAGIGSKFDKRQWQETLQAAHVNSITCFSLCHHGWSYHPTSVGKMHPNLKFNLLRSQIDACKEIDVNVPVYLTAGLNNVASAMHPQWREIDADGRFSGWASSPTQPGFHKMCFNSPYLDYLCELIGEAVKMFPEGDGIFLDIIRQGRCYCKYCMEKMRTAGINPENPDEHDKFTSEILMRYYRQTTAAAKQYDCNMRIFHNSSHIQSGQNDILPFFSHLELESLPTGGWGYDHFPLSAAYARNLGLDFLGMTGKFHTSWGEFGGIKHPNALRYECASMLAQGAKCSVGDQLHPNGRLDSGTFRLIGTAYREVEAKEPWCQDAVSAANVAILSSSAVNHSKNRGAYSEFGASRILLEGHIPFDMLDQSMDFCRYKMLILPDDVPVDDQLQTKLESFISAGGKLIMSGASGLKPDHSGFAVNPGISFHGQSPFQPDYVLPTDNFRPDFVDEPMVMYFPSQRIKVETGQSLGQVFDPSFNRTYAHFCSHQHAPAMETPSGFDAGVITDNILYFAHPVFSIYYAYGAVAYKTFILKAILQLLGQDLQIRTDLASQGRVTLMQQPEQQRYIVHLLYVNTILRGGAINGFSNPYLRPPGSIEVIEDLNSLSNVNVELKIDQPVHRVTLEPQGKEISFKKLSNERVLVNIGELLCHQMIVLHYSKE